MFSRGSANAYDEIVVKATDENQTSENWEIILNLCDKVQDEGEQGARNVVAAVLKRLAHRNANVQLYSLAVAEALSKNCGLEVHREIASRAFTQGLERIVTDRTGHDKVKKKTLVLIHDWALEFEEDATLGIMNELYTSLKSKGHKFEQPMEAPPPQVDDEIRRQEEEELQRALEISVQDKGGRGHWSGYTPSAAAASSSASLNNQQPSSATSSSRHAQTMSGYTPGPGPTSHTSHSTARAASPIRQPQPSVTTQAPAYTQTYAPPYSAATTTATTTATATAIEPSTVSPRSPTVDTINPASSPVSAPVSAPALSLETTSRVRALHSFEPADSGELAFEKGDIIKVVDRTHKDWWRGQLKGRTGIFPVNYVEPMPDPTPAEIAREAEAETSVFNQAANIDKLLNMLKTFDIQRDNLADNEDIQELYRSSMTLRPKIVRLIDKYSQKKAELVQMNDSYVKARNMFDRMMEESLAKHNPSLYEHRYQQPGYWTAYPQPAQAGYANYPPAPYPDQQAYAQQQHYGPAPMDPAAYAAQQAYQVYDANATYYSQQQNVGVPGQPAYPQQPGADPSAYPQQIHQSQPQAQGQAPPPMPDHNTYAAQPQPDHNTYAAQPQPGQLQQQQPAPYGQPTSATSQPTVAQPQPDAHAQPQFQSQPQLQQLSTDPVQSQQYVAGQTQPNGIGYPQQVDTTNTQSQPDPQQQQEETQIPPGPFVYDPNGHYDDPNVQAWAQYYAAGGDDPAGAVYFISVPSIKDPSGGDPNAEQQGQSQPQQQGQQPQGHQSPTQGEPAPWAAQQPVHGHTQAAEGVRLNTTSPAQAGGGIGAYAGYHPQRAMSPSSTAPGADPYGQVYGHPPYGHPQQAV